MAYSPKFLDKHRYINVDDTDSDWAEYIVEGFKTDMRERGFAIDRVYWSGFCCQGDGACCDGYVNDIQAVLTYHNLTDTYPMIAQAQMQSAFTSWKHTGRYYHRFAMVFDHEYDDLFSDALGHIYDVPLLEDSGVTQFEDAFYKEVDDLRGVVKDLVQQYCSDLYDALNKEYDYLTADEHVADTLEANDIREDDDDENYA